MKHMMVAQSQYMMDFTLWLLLSALLLILLALKQATNAKTKNDENQKEMLSLLREIKEAVKK